MVLLWEIKLLINGQIIYVGIGGSDGYNGGGTGNRVGGGATHVATESGLLRDLEAKKASVLIVARRRRWSRV